MTTPIIQSNALNSRGEPVFAMNASADNIGDWAPTVTAIRDAALSFRIGMVDWGGGSLDGFKPECRPFVPTQAETEKLNLICHEAVTAGRLIDFGHLPNSVIQECGHRGGPLWNQGAIGWPFSDPWMFCHSWEDGVCAYAVNPKDGAFEICELRPLKIGGVGMLTINDRGAFSRGPSVNEYTCTLAPSMLHFVAHGDIAERINRGASPYESAAGNLADPVMAALLILNTRNVERTTVAASEKLQRARAKTGKPRIPPHDIVNTAPYVTAIQSRGTRRERVEHGGTHASPVFHLRMGHPRHYADGRSIFIADTLVNATDEQRANFKSTRSHYSVRP